MNIQKNMMKRRLGREGAGEWKRETLGQKWAENSFCEEITS